MLFHLFLHGWWLLEHGPLQSGFWWKRCCLEAKFAKIRKCGKIYGKSYFSRRLRMPEDGVEVGHRGPTPPPSAGQAWPRGQVVWSAAGPSPYRILALDPFRKNRHFGFCPVQFREYSFSDFPGTKNSRKQAAGTMALVNRLVQEIIWKVLQSVDKT